LPIKRENANAIRHLKGLCNLCSSVA